MLDELCSATWACQATSLLEPANVRVREYGYSLQPPAVPAPMQAGLPQWTSCEW